MDYNPKEKGRLQHNALIVRNLRTIAYHDLVGLLIFESDQLLHHLISVERVTLLQVSLRILDLLTGLLYGCIGRSSRLGRWVDNRPLILARFGRTTCKGWKRKDQSLK